VKIKKWIKSVLDRDLWKTILVEIKCVYGSYITLVYELSPIF
jgi:hypothetical protein